MADDETTDDESTRTFNIGIGASFVKHALGYQATDWQPSVRDEAVRLWVLSGAFPDAPAGALLSVVKGVDGYALTPTEDLDWTLTVPDNNERTD